MDDHCENWRDQIRRRIDGELDGNGIQLDEHLERCQACRDHHRSLNDDHQRLAGHTASLDDVVVRIEDRVIENLNLGTDATDQEGMARVIPLRRRIMSVILTKYGVAAAMVLALAAGFGIFNQTNDAGVAWADVLKQVTAARSVTYKAVTGEGGRSAEIKIRTAADHSAVYDMYMGDKIFMRIFYDPDEQAMITLMPAMKQYMRKKLTREEFRELKKTENPSYLLERLLSYEHTDLGASEIDGVMAVGIESDDPRLSAGVTEPFSIRLWADAKTKWPVRVELFHLDADGGEELMSTLTDFRWNEDLDPVAFTMDIPADYKPQGMFSDFTVDEEHAVEGLILYSRYMDRFPDHLAMTDAGDLVEAMTPATGPAVNPAMAVEQLKFYLESCMYHLQLTNEQRDVAWYGDTVHPGDSDRILWRWRQDDGDYRVIYGDLSAETVSPDLLEQLEN